MLVSLAIALCLPLGVAVYMLWAHVSHQREVRAYAHAESVLAGLTMAPAFGQLRSSGANCSQAADRRCFVSDQSPSHLVGPLTNLLGPAAHVMAGADCRDWDPRPPADLTAAITRMPCTIIGSVGGHEAVGILWLHHYPLGARTAPRNALTITDRRFVNYYGGSDITLELVHPPSS